MTPPDNERRVLTWIRNKGGLEQWQIDSHDRNIGWLEASVWSQKVLYWKELDPKPEYAEVE